MSLPSPWSEEFYTDEIQHHDNKKLKGVYKDLRNDLKKVDKAYNKRLKENYSLRARSDIKGHNKIGGQIYNKHQKHETTTSSDVERQRDRMDSIYANKYY